MQLIGLMLIFSGIILFEVPRMWKDKMWRELITFSGLLTVGMVMSFAAVLRIDLPNPTKVIDFIFNPLSEVILSFLKQ